jgi:endonuclease/exonuclease/phosphatase family metal-dependent hydrolase
MTKALKVLQLNCLHLGQDRRYEMIVEAIQAANPDLGMLQEVNNHERVMELLAQAGYEHTLIALHRASNGDGESVMLFSKTPLESPKLPEIKLPKAIGRTLVGVTTVDGVKIVLISSHSPWGGNTEGVRLKHNEVIDRLADEVAYHAGAQLTILGADLNAEPDYRSIRYLLGRDLASDGSSATLWTDAWGSVGSPENEITISAKSNELASGIANRTGAVNSLAVPDRRIDYLMTRGWNYGRRGGFLSFERLTHPQGLEVSDHYGLVAEVQL